MTQTTQLNGNGAALKQEQTDKCTMTNRLHASVAHVYQMRYSLTNLNLQGTSMP